MQLCIENLPKNFYYFIECRTHHNVLSDKVIAYGLSCVHYGGSLLYFFNNGKGTDHWGKQILGLKNLQDLNKQKEKR